MLSTLKQAVSPLVRAMRQLDENTWVFGDVLLITQRTDQPSDAIYHDGTYSYTVTEMSKGFRMDKPTTPPQAPMRFVRSDSNVAIWRIGNLYFCAFRDYFTKPGHSSGKNWMFIREVRVHTDSDRTFMVLKPCVGTPLEEMWTGLSDTMREHYREEIRKATQQVTWPLALRTRPTPPMPAIVSAPASDQGDHHRSDTEDEKRITWCENLVPGVLEETWATYEFGRILTEADIEYGLGPDERLEFDEAVIVPDGIVVLPNGWIGVANFQIAGRPRGKKRSVVHNVICPMDFNGSWDVSTFPKAKVGLKTRLKNPDGPCEPRTTWLSASEALPGHDDWKSNPRTGLMAILEKSRMP